MYYTYLVEGGVHAEVVVVFREEQREDVARREHIHTGIPPLLGLCPCPQRRPTRAVVAPCK